MGVLIMSMGSTGRCLVGSMQRVWALSAALPMQPFIVLARVLFPGKYWRYGPVSVR